MRKLKIIIASSIVIFGFSISQAQSVDLPQHPSTVISNYKVEANAPFLSLTGQWIFWGLAPDNFTLSECIGSNNEVENFSILLVDDDGSNWVELYSDTLKRSMVKLPNDAGKTMGIDGIKFIRFLRQLFADTGQHYLSGKVTLGDSLFNAWAVDLRSSIPKTRRFLVRTYVDNEVYIEGEVLIEYKNNMVVYREVNLFVKQSELQLKLTLLNTQTK
ncbi:MAG: hypothetical protein V1712_03045 [Patescibacteria group bacterium]